MLRFLYFSATVGNIALFLSIAIFRPKYRKFLVDEDSYMENLSALLFLTAALLFLLLLIVQLRSLRERRIYLPLLAVSTIGFLDELSYGERIFGYKPITFGEKYELDAVHDLLQITVGLLNERPWLAIPLTLVLAALAIWAGLTQRQRIAQLPAAIRAYPSYGYFLIACVFVIIAMIIDLQHRMPPVVWVMEELFEMNAGLTMVFAALAAVRWPAWQPLAFPKTKTS